MDEPALDPPEIVNQFLASSTVVIFSKTWCPYCTKAKDLLSSLKVEYVACELDLRPDGPSIQDYLHQQTGQKTVPSVFINKKHVGGFTDLYRISQSGILPDYLLGQFQDFDYDLIVIGGGSGGLSAAKTAAKFSQRVAVLDFVKPSPLGTKWGLGGTCVNVGCIPKKLMHRAALIHEDILDAPFFGWDVPEPTEHKWEELVTNVQGYIKSLNFSYKKELKESKVEYLNMFGSFEDKHTIRAENSQGETKLLTAKSFVIAVGGRPLYPDVPGALDLCITSDDLFSLSHQPKTVLIIGASYIALECAGFLAGIGCDVTVMVRSILLRGFDQDMAERIGVSMADYGVKFIRPCVPTGFRKEGDLIIASGLMASGEKYESGFDTVLCAVGRKACTDSLKLDSIGVQMNPKNNKITVDAWDRSSVPNIFAIGDVMDGCPELTPVAIQAGNLLAQRLYSPTSSKLMDYTNVPTTVFTPLEYGCAGLSEEDASVKYKGEIEVFHNLFTPLENTLSKRFGSKHCYAKLVCAKKVDDKIMKVVGIHILGPSAGEIIQGYAIALKLGATKEHFDDLVGIHPTVAEVFTTLSVTKSSNEQLKSGGC